MREPKNTIGSDAEEEGTLEHRGDISLRKGFGNKGIIIGHRCGQRYERDYEEGQS